MNTNQITKALISAGIIDNVVALETRAPGSYVFEAEASKVVKSKTAKGIKTESVLTDPITDAKFVPALVNLAHEARVGAILRENGKEAPLFDREEDEEDSLTACHKPSDRATTIGKALSEADAATNDSVVWRIAEHAARVEGNEWLRSITKLSLVTDTNGLLQAVRTTDEIIRPFDGWLQAGIERAPADSSWGLACRYVKQLGHSATPSIGFDEAKAKFKVWLDSIPFTFDGSGTATRREKVVAAVADRKWNALVKAALSGINKDIAKAQKDWIICAYSPKAAIQVEAIKASTEYQLLLVDRENIALTKNSDALELANRRMLLDQNRLLIQMGQLKLQAQQDEYQKQFGLIQAQMKAMLGTTEAVPFTGSKLPDLAAQLNKRAY
jgi:hypothetical protein